MTHKVYAWLILTLVALTLFNLPMQATAQMSATPQAANPAEPHLSPAQQAQVKARQAQFMQQITALKNDKNLTMPQKQAKFLQYRQSLDQDMLSYLTPAQRTGVIQARQKQQSMQQAYIAGMHTKINQVNQLAQSINKSETPAQLKSLHAIGLIERAKIQKLQADSSLSEQSKRARMDIIRRDATVKINAVLTPAQRAKFAQLQQMTQPGN